MTPLQNGLLHAGVFAYALAVVFSIRYWKNVSARDMIVARLCVLAGCLLHLFVLLHIGVEHRVLPMSNMLESSVFMTTILMALVLLIDLFNRAPFITIVASPLAVCYIVCALALLSPPKGSERPDSNLIIDAHVLATMLSYAAFAVAFVTGLIFLIEERKFKAKSEILLYRVFPSIEAVQKINTRACIVGFLLLTAGIVVGYLYGRQAQKEGGMADDWRYSPKVLLTSLTWLAYLTLLALRLRPSFRGRKAMIASVLCFILVIATFWATVFWKDFHNFIEPS